MRYIKTYEMKYDENIKVGDYFLVSLLSYSRRKLEPYIWKDGRKTEGIDEVKVRYLSEKDYDHFYAETTKGELLYLNKNDIYRKLTPEEIENFEIKKSSIKYNL
jgi:hypothetical protein